jgi:hypothetical protein
MQHSKTKEPGTERISAQPPEWFPMSMSIRTATIWTALLLLAILVLPFCVHVMTKVYHGEKANLAILPIAVPALGLLLGWPLIVVIIIVSFVKHHIPGIFLLSSVVIYGVISSLVLTNFFNAMPMASGMTFLFPIFVSLYILLPIWLLGTGLEMLFRWIYQ